MPVAVLDAHNAAFALAGLAALAGALAPRLVRDRPLSTPVVCLALGAVVFVLPLGLDHPDPLRHGDVAEYLTEIGVVVSLMGAGLKLDRVPGWSRWSTTVRLLAVTMPLTIAATALLGWGVVGLAPAAALLLGAALAPTDPVLAADVQVGPPGETAGEGDGAEDEVRFALTSEAGLNDALAFPFTNAAIAMAVAGTAPEAWVGEWLTLSVVYKLAVGLLAGLAVGRLLGRLVFASSDRFRLSAENQGFAVLAVTFGAYGLTELLGGYSFLAVFVAGVALRGYERDHAYHETLHDFAVQAEHLLSIGLLVLLGGAVTGGLLGALTWPAAVVGLLLVFAVRPAAAWFSLSGLQLAGGERAAIAFFGIRGVGSIYYVAHALNEAPFAEAELLWSLVAFVVVVSILVHGVTATPAMRRLDARREALRAGL